VSDRLHARDWVTCYAVGWWQFDPAKGRDAATVLRAYAFHGGPRLLDAVLPHLLGDQRLVTPACDRATPEGRLDRSIRLGLDVEMLPWGAQTDQKVLKLHLELLGNAQKASPGRANGGFAAPNVLETLDQAAGEALRKVPRPTSAPPARQDNPVIAQTG
jgi:hypothetical protein